MGTKYCKPVRSTPEQLEILQCLPMLEVRTKYNFMTKAHNKKGYYFFSNQELKHVFNLTDEQVYFIVSTYTSNQDVIRVGSIDFWCSLALAASGSSNDKISFGFKLIDTNNDDFVSYNELIVLFICATRGVARLKGLTYVPEHLIDQIVIRAFQVYQKDLNERGEISMKDLIEYLLTNENCRAYLAGLGAKLPPVDSAAMVLKRAHILRELAQLRFQMDDIVCELEDAKDNYDVSKERGGDIDLLRMGEMKPPDPEPSMQNSAQMSTASTAIVKDELELKGNNQIPKAHVLSESENPAINDRKLPISLSSSSFLHTIAEDDEFEVIKELLGKDHPVNKYFGYDDSWLGEIYNKPRPYLDKKARFKSPEANKEDRDAHVNIYGKSFEELLLKEWRKIPQDADLMVRLDEFTLMALFQQLNVNITFYLARKCLQALPKSQLQKYNFHDVLQWIRKNYIEHELERDPKKNHSRFTNAWFEYIRKFKDSFEQLNQSYSDFSRFISRQRKIVTGLTNPNDVSYAKKLADFRAMCLKKPSFAEFKYSFNKLRNDDADESNDNIKKSPMKKSVEKSIVDQTLPATKLRINITTNPFTNLSTKRPKDSTRMKVIMENGREFIMIKDPDGFDANDVLDYYNLCAEKDWLKKMQELKKHQNDSTSNQGFSKPPLSRNSSFYSSGYGSISKSSKSLLDEPNDDGKKQEDEGPIEYKSTVWFGVDVKKDVDHAYTILLQESLQKFFETLPLTYRKHIYTKVVTEICCLEPSAEELGKKRKRTSAMENLIAAVLGKQEEESMWSMGKRIVLVVLLHEEDHFLRVEQSLLEADLFFSRFLQNFYLNVELQQSISEIFANSIKYFKFEEKLFGPQEEDLGEEGSNPLRFAKEIRSQKKHCKDILEKVNSLPREELQQHCRKYGRSDQGTNAQLIERVKDIISERLELIGFGELSNYGKAMIQQVFDRIKARPKFPANIANAVSAAVSQNYDESGLKLWEFNQLLCESGSKTLYDKEAYLDLVEEYRMLLDRNQNCKVEGLFGYYERFGKLHEDILSWGIGNLDSFLSGQIAGNIVFDTESLFSLTHLFSKLTTTQDATLNIPSFYQLLAKITSIKEFKIEGELKCLSDLISLLPWNILGLDNIRQRLMLCLTKPGGFVEFVMDIAARWSDGEEGLLPVLRQCATDWKNGSVNNKTAQDVEDNQADVITRGVTQKATKNFAENDEIHTQEETMADKSAEVNCPKMDWILFDEIFKKEFLEAASAKVEIAMQEEDAMKKAKEEERLAAEQKAFDEAEAQRIRLEQQGAVSTPHNKEANLTKQELEELKAKEKEEIDAQMKREYDIKHGAIREVAKDFLRFERNLPDNLHEEPVTTDSSKEFIKSDNDMDNVSALSPQTSDCKEGDQEHATEPKMIPIKTNEDWKQLREAIVDDLLFLHSIRQMNNLVVTLDESIAIESTKRHYLELLQHLHVLEYDHYERLTYQFLAVYDALRMFSTGFSNIGMGTRDFCCRAQLEYNLKKDNTTINCINMMEWLPLGMGELIHVKELLREKKQRFERRRIGALAALERERLRRQMTDEDHERLRLQKQEALRLEYEKEEKLLFDNALSLLMNSRESRKNSQELNVLVKAFEKICLLKEKRFPDDYGVNIARNNLACVLLEIYGSEHPLCEPVEFYLKDAVERVIAQHQVLVLKEKEKLFKELQEKKKPPGHEFAEYLEAAGVATDQNSFSNSLNASTIAIDSDQIAPQAGNQEVAMDESMSLDEIEVNVPIPNPSTAAMIIVNYIDVLFKNDSTTALRQIFPIKEFFSKCYDSMTPKEQETIMVAVVPEYRNIPVFSTNKKPETIIKNMLQEVAYFTAKKKADEESLRTQSESLEAPSIAQEEESVASTIDTESTAKRIRKKNKDKLKKSEEQRHKDNKVRAETARQRRFLYELIQSDQISKIFAAKAGQVDGAKKWVSAEDQDFIQTASDEFATMMQGKTGKHEHS